MSSKRPCHRPLPDDLRETTVNYIEYSLASLCAPYPCTALRLIIDEMGRGLRRDGAMQ